jgi:DNA-binding NarL/FixJ family response regulator
MTQRIRVVVANRPRLMRELVLGAILEQQDIEVVGEIKDEDEIPNAIERTRPDFLIIALNETDQRPALCDTLIRLYPEMRILALAPERNFSIFYWGSFGIHESVVETSEAGVLSTLRLKSMSVGG